jgi:hypothetical protein
MIQRKMGVTGLRVLPEVVFLRIFRWIFRCVFFLCPALVFGWENSQPRAKILSFPLSVTATFAEYRGNHFHSGLDFSTGNRNGLPVFAVAAGRVYRVKRSHYGTGNTVYLRHGDGSIAVYAHLSGFHPDIEDLLPERYEADFFPAKMVMINKGEQLGFSGESGRGLSHLHFELRNSTNQPVALSPEDLGVKDRFAPVLKKIILQPYLSEEPPLLLPVAQLKPDSLVEVSGPVGLQVVAYDGVNNRHSKCHVPEWRVYGGKELLFHLRTELLSFTDNPAVATVFNRQQTGLMPSSYTYKLYRDFVQPSRNIRSERNYGVFTEGLHDVRIIAGDFSANETELSFRLLVKGDGKDGLKTPQPYAGNLRFTFSGFQFIFPENSFSVNETPQFKDIFSPEDLPGKSHFINGFSLGPSFLFWHKKVVVQYAVTHDKKAFFMSRHGVSGRWQPMETEFLPGLIRTFLYFATDVVLASDQGLPLIDGAVKKQADYMDSEAYYIQVSDLESGIDENSAVLSCNGSPRDSRFDRERSWLRFDGRDCQQLRLRICDKTGNCAQRDIQ